MSFHPPPIPRFPDVDFPDPVTVVYTGQRLSSQGGVIPDPTGVTNVMATVQERPDVAINLMLQGGTGTEGITRIPVMVGFPTDPGVGRGDAISWKGKTLNVLGEAIDSGGWGWLYWVTCERIA